jgi:hypothetical protein
LLLDGSPLAKASAMKKTTRRSGVALVGVLVCAGTVVLGGATGLCQLRAEVAERVGRAPRGGTAIDGDAVDRYAVALWALSDRTAPAPERGSVELEPMPVRGVALDALLSRARAALAAGRPLDAGDREVLAAYEPVVDLLRDGLRCDRCDWRGDAVDPVAVTRAAELLALAAERGADGGIVARGCLDVVAFGADVARLEASTGARASEVGLAALARVLDADRLSPEQVAEVTGTLRDLGGR